jgi:sugar phosphate isomerase/epimerase
MKFEVGLPADCGGGEAIAKTLVAIARSEIDSVMITQNAELEKNIKTAQELGLKIVQVHLNNTSANDLWVSGVTQDSYVNSVISGIEVCGKYGIKIATMHATSGQPIATVIPPNKNALVAMQKILTTAERCGVKIAIENTDGLNIKHFFYILDNLKSPGLGFCYDCGHHYLYTPKVDLMKKYGSRCITMHLHDNLRDWKVGLDWTRDLHVLPFDGNIDFNKVACDISKCPNDMVLMLECYHSTVGTPKPYADITIDDFIKKAYGHAERLYDKIEALNNK